MSMFTRALIKVSVTLTPVMIAVTKAGQAGVLGRKW